MIDESLVWFVGLLCFALGYVFFAFMAEIAEWSEGAKRDEKGKTG